MGDGLRQTWLWLALLGLATCLSGARASFCSMLVVPALQISAAGVVQQETLDWVGQRLCAFLDEQNATDVRLGWLSLAAAAVANQTVLSGWVQSQNRFGLCFAESHGGGISSGLSTGDLGWMNGITSGGIRGVCDSDPSVIGHLQTVSMVMVRDVFYRSASPGAGCPWVPSCGASGAQFAPRAGYVPGSTNGASPATNDSPAPRRATPLGPLAPLLAPLAPLLTLCTFLFSAAARAAATDA
jgi:hypothetical protein